MTYHYPGAPERVLARWVVAQWNGFPVDQDPRPFVFTGPIVLPGRGFTTVEAKMAFGRGEVEARGDVPDDVVALLRSVGSPDNHPGPVGPLILMEGRQSQAEFSTDRGERVLPAWRFEGEQLLEGLAVLDPAIARQQWGRPDPPAQPAPAGRRGHRRRDRGSNRTTEHFTTDSREAVPSGWTTQAPRSWSLSRRWP